MAGGGDFATGFFSTIGDKMNKTLDQHREDDVARKKAMTDLWTQVLQNPDAPQEQKDRAWKELQKLYPEKESKGALQKFQTLFHLGHALHGAQKQQQGGGEMSEQTPIGGSSTQIPNIKGATPMGAGAPAATQPNANIMAPQVPAKAGPTPPPAAAALGPGYAAAAARPGGGPSPPPGATAQAQAPPEASPPKGAGGRTSKTADLPTEHAPAVAPTTEQMLATYRKKAEIDADVAVKKWGARRVPNALSELIDSFERDNSRPPNTKELQDLINSTKSAGKSGVSLEEAAYFQALHDGDTDKAHKILEGISKLKVAEKVQAASMSRLGLLHQIYDPNVPDEQKKIALKAVQEDLRMKKEEQQSRGYGYAIARAQYTFGGWLDPATGSQSWMSNYDAAERMKHGQVLIGSGRMGAEQITAVQRFVAESMPAIKEVRDHLSAYSNATDREVFARVLDDIGPMPGDEIGFFSWFGNVMDQVLKDKALSKNGQYLANRLIRLRDTTSTLQKALGANSTDSSRAMLIQLIPGPTTQNEEMARDLLDQFEQVVTNASGVPFLKPIVGAQSGGGATNPKPRQTPPPGSDNKTRPPLASFEH